jgi:hypothetical protein
MGALNRRNCFGIVSIPIIAIVSFLVNKHALSADPLTLTQQVAIALGIPDETDVRAPVDYGSERREALKAEIKSGDSLNISGAPAGGAMAKVAGVFGPAVTWPINPIHMVLLPDGRVMNYGTNQSGQQTALHYYDVWDPTLGTDISAHRVLPNTTNDDIFCSAQSVMTSGDVLISGGDLTVSGRRNFARNNTDVFSPTRNTLSTNTPMHYPRWYGSLVALPDGQLAIFGGKQNTVLIAPIEPVVVPEEYNPATKAWRSLTGATSAAAFGALNWYYPRAYVSPGGAIFVLGFDGTIYSVSTAGLGSISKYAVTMPRASASLPTIPFAPGKALSLRTNQQVVVVDFSQSLPVVTKTDSIDQVRYWASGTILADGKVLITGGSQVDNVLTGVAYQAQMWNPATGHWTAGASARKPRLYHSSAVLLPDATVLTGGGGAPGPVNNLNAEIYYPPYLYANNGSPAARPVITDVAPLGLNPGDAINLTVGPTDKIARLNLVRTGSATHSSNSDQRFITLPFTQTAQNVTATLLSDSTVLVPGHYMLFVFNNAGVPSVARMLNVK